MLMLMRMATMLMMILNGKAILLLDNQCEQYRKTDRVTV